VLAQTLVPRQTAEEGETPPTEPSLKAGASDWVFMPIPISNPSIGTGLAVAALNLFPFGGAKQPSLVGFGAVATDNGSWVVGGGTQLRFDEDRWRVNFGGAVGDIHSDFYGIGENAGDLGASIPIAMRTNAVIGSVLRRIGYGFYAGAGLRYAGTKTVLDGDVPPGPLANLLSAGLTINTMGVGLIGQYDTRDSNFGPRSGAFGSLKFYRFDEALGSDLEYEKTDGQWNQYFGIGRYGVIAARASLCNASGDAPFFDLCQFGQSNDLRGYVSGRYRDHAMYAVQAEYRSPFFHRFGAVVFAGFGQVAPDWGSFGGEFLKSAGTGVRYLASEKNRVTLSVDYSRAKGDDAWYFYIGDAF
jgi:outer membrane protein assembly factor BamA